MYQNILLKIAYDGSGFYGFQKQNGLRTISSCLNEAVNAINGKKTRIISAGRTDKKVHADGQLVNFLSTLELPGRAYSHLLNKILPKDIYVIESKSIPLDCNIRFAAYKKRYRYELLESQYIHPKDIAYMGHCSYILDTDTFYETAKIFVGKYNFSAFSIFDEERECHREIYDFQLKKQPYKNGKGTLWSFHITGDSFLREQVRIMIGSMVRVARGLYKKEDIINALKKGKSEFEFPAASPEGLYLEKVYWENKKYKKNS